MKKLFTLFAVAALAFAAQANELTVCDNGVEGSDAWGSVPVYGYWYDSEGFTQMVYPAEMLSEMAGGTISELKFYTAACWGEDYSDYTITFSGSQVVLALKEVEENSFDADAPVAFVGATPVAVFAPEGGEMYMTFVLDEPFEYNGGNLLVECSWDGNGTWGRTYFLGEEVENTAAYYKFDYYGTWSEYAFNVLSMVTFTYTPGSVTPPEPPTPTEKTGAPVFNGYTEDGIHAYMVEILPTEPSVIYYRIQYPDGTWTEWAEYEEILSFTGDGKYRVEAYAVAENKLPSEEIAYEFVVSPVVGIDEMMSGKTISNVRYFNMAGQEMTEAYGMTIVVTTYTDGTTSAVKVMK